LYAFAACIAASDAVVESASVIDVVGMVVDGYPSAVNPLIAAANAICD